MKTQLIVDGMHCDACKSLIEMELDDNGFTDKVSSLTLNGNNTGTIDLDNVNESELEQIKELVNSMDGYQIN